MKIISPSLIVVSLGSVVAFSPSLSRQPQQQQLHTVTRLNLFGGGAKKDSEGGEKKALGMMDQLAMLKKAQEVANKKNKLDQELAAMDFEGSSDDGNVKAIFKYIPSKNPMDPSPEYDAVSFTFEDSFYDSASPDDVSAAVKAAITDAIQAVNKGVEEKYETLKADVAETFGALGGAPTM